jgi:protein-tyrosine-phosphatase
MPAQVQPAPVETHRVRPQSVLFACTLNTVRSPMAEALARHYFGREIYFASAGLKRGDPDGFAITAMEEIGIDISRHKPRTFEDLEDSSFDVIVTLSPEAHHRALEFTRAMAVEVIYWPTPDPTATQGSRETMLDAYRDVRDRLAARIKAFLSRATGSGP